MNRITSVHAEVGGQKVAAVASPPNQTAVAPESPLGELGESVGNLSDRHDITVTPEDLRLATEREKAKRWGADIAIVQEREELVLSSLTSLDFGVSQETIDLLIRQLAYTQVLANVERAYRLIFGSQIAVLKFLNLNGNQTFEDLMPFYERTAAAFIEAGTTYRAGPEGFFGFLIKQGLIRPLNDERNHLALSEFGKCLLVWMVQEGISDEKSF